MRRPTFFTLVIFLVRDMTGVQLLVLELTRGTKVLIHRKTISFILFKNCNMRYKMHAWLQNSTFWDFWDVEFFGMSSYMCKNFQDDIPNIFNFHHMGLKWVLNFKKTQNQIFGMRSSSGWVLTHVRTFRMTFQTFSKFAIWYYIPFLIINQGYCLGKIKFRAKGVLWDEFSTSLEFSILSYGPKLHSWDFTFKKRVKNPEN